MTEPFIQPAARPWPSGDCTPVAHLELEPAEIADRLGIRFTPGRDDLGEFVEAAIQMASGRLLLFLRYAGSPAPGTSVLADARDDLRAAENDVNALLAL